VVGVLFAGGAGDEARGEADRRVRALAQRLVDDRAHGLTLLYTLKGSSYARELRTKLTPRAAEGDVKGGASAGGTSDEGVQGTADGNAHGGGDGDEFVVVRLAGSRFAEVHWMAEDVSDESLRAFSSRFTMGPPRTPRMWVEAAAQAVATALRDAAKWGEARVAAAIATSSPVPSPVSLSVLLVALACAAVAIAACGWRRWVASRGAVQRPAGEAAAAQSVAKRTHSDGKLKEQ
jgi:hypothetical protein